MSCSLPMPSNAADQLVPAKGPSPLRRLPLFLVLSLGDLALTWTLLRYRQGLVYEGNPLAAWCMESFGWTGVAALKGGSVVMVGAIAAFLSNRHPPKGRLVLSFGCWVLTAVMIYSIIMGLMTGSASSCPDLPAIWERARHLDNRAEVLREHHELRAQLVRDLVTGRRTLPGAAAELARSRWAREPFWHKVKLVGGRTGFPQQPMVAAELMELAVAALGESLETHAQARRLRQEYCDTYRTSPPLISH